MKTISLTFYWYGSEREAFYWKEKQDIKVVIQDKMIGKEYFDRITFPWNESSLSHIIPETLPEKDQEVAKAILTAVLMKDEELTQVN